MTRRQIEIYHALDVRRQEARWINCSGPLTVFKKDFPLFSESSLVDLDWSNVVAAGSSVVTPFLPAPDKFSTSKKAPR